VNPMSQYDPETMARASRRGEPISFKQSVELAKHLRGMRSDRALTLLDGVIAQRVAVPFTRFTDGAGHKRGIGPGKYPVKAATAFQLLLQSAIANAENKGLGTPLKIVSLIANNGNGDAHYGRQRSRQAKSTHLEVTLAETAESKRAPKREKKRAKKQGATVPAVKESPKKSGQPKEPGAAPAATPTATTPAADKTTPVTVKTDAADKQGADAAKQPAASVPKTAVPVPKDGMKAERPAQPKDVKQDGN